MAPLERCPSCNLPYAIVGRAHLCRPPRTVSVAEPVQHTAPEQMATATSVPTALAGIQADAPAIGAYQSAMGVTPPATGEGLNHLHDTANRGEPAPICVGVDLATGDDVSATALMQRKPDGTLDVTTIITNRKPPKRDRAAYMRGYRASVKAKKLGGAA